MTLRELLAVMASVYVVDAVLTPVGFAIATVDEPAAAVVGPPLVALLAFRP